MLTFWSNLSRSLFIFAWNTGGHSYEEKGSFTSVTGVYGKGIILQKGIFCCIVVSPSVVFILHIFVHYDVAFDVMT